MRLLSCAAVWLVFAAGCAPHTPLSIDHGQTPKVELAGTSWRLVTVGEEAALEQREATLEFPEAGKAAGRASCNRFSGTVEISGESLRFGPLAATKMSCGEAADAQEQRYLQALRAAERFDFDGPQLRVYSRGIEKPLRFARR